MPRLGLNVIVSFGLQAGLADSIIQGIKTLIQLLIFFWISYSLLQYDRIRKGALLTLAVSCVLVAFLQFLGVTDDITDPRPDCGL